MPSNDELLAQMEEMRRAFEEQTQRSGGQYMPTVVPEETAKSRKRLRRELERIDYENAKAKYFGIVTEWTALRNSIARSLVRMALYSPGSFTSVKNYERKLHNALSHGLWVNEDEKTAHPLTKNDISKIVAMVASIAGEKKQRTINDIEALSRLVQCDEKTNEMNALMRGMGLYNFKLPELEKRYEFMKTLKKTYKFMPELDVGVSMQTEHMDEWWKYAIRSAISSGSH